MWSAAHALVCTLCDRPFKSVDNIFQPLCCMQPHDWQLLIFSEAGMTAKQSKQRCRSVDTCNGKMPKVVLRYINQLTMYACMHAFMLSVNHVALLFTHACMHACYHACVPLIIHMFICLCICAFTQPRCVFPRIKYSPEQCVCMRSYFGTQRTKIDMSLCVLNHTEHHASYTTRLSRKVTE